MNALLAAYKPVQISCNQFLNRLKNTYQVKKAGFSGTLDPFARGCLIVGFGNYTKLFPYINKSPKTYKATLWLGAKSLSLDMENIVCIDQVKAFDQEHIKEILSRLQGDISYIPPSFSAKKINGKRAYELSRKGLEVKLKQTKMYIFTMDFLNYTHPYISFQVSVSEGTYIRSIGEMIANALGINATLSSLSRLSEGKVVAKEGQEIMLNPLSLLPYPIISNLSTKIEENLRLGRKFYLPHQDCGIYVANFEEFFSIIEVREDKSIKYLLNRMNKC